MQKADLIKEAIDKAVYSGEINNDSLVQIIELCRHYLNPLTISDYSRKYNISYNGAKKHKKQIIIFGNVKFIIDND